MSKRPKTYAVRMSEELFLAIGERDDEYVTVEWGEPDEQGFYTPTVTRHLQPTVLLRDTPEDRERLAAALHEKDSNASAIGGIPCRSCERRADAIIAALREWWWGQVRPFTTVHLVRHGRTACGREAASYIPCRDGYRIPCLSCTDNAHGILFGREPP